MTIRYSASRRDVWAWYWMSWHRDFWRIWVLAGAASFAAILFAGAAAHPIGSGDAVVAGGFVAILWVVLAVYPQFVFKSAERILTIAPGGIDTEIGTKFAHYDWQKIGPITVLRGNVVIPVVRSKNAFLVPDRAFSDDGQRRKFLAQAEAWQTAAAVNVA